MEALSTYLSIPKEVTNRTISGSHLSIVSGNIYHIHCGPAYDAEDYHVLVDQLDNVIQEGRQGLIQGSALSSLVFEHVLAPALSLMPSCGRIVSYVDNILVMAKTEDDLKLMINELGGLLKKHPVGPFMSRLENKNAPTNIHEFLGHRISASKSGFAAAPSKENEALFNQRLEQGLNVIRDPVRSHRVRLAKAKHLRLFVRSWTAAFATWRKASAFRDQCLTRIDKTVTLNLGNIAA